MAGDVACQGPIQKEIIPFEKRTNRRPGDDRHKWMGLSRLPHVRLATDDAKCHSSIPRSPPVARANTIQMKLRLSPRLWSVCNFDNCAVAPEYTQHTSYINASTVRLMPTRSCHPNFQCLPTRFSLARGGEMASTVVKGAIRNARRRHPSCRQISKDRLDQASAQSPRRRK